MVKLQIVEGGVCAPLGFSAAGVPADINGKGNQKKDVAILYSTVPATAAGVFTLNTVKAAPLIVTQAALKAQQLQAVVINARNANACTGERGLRDAHAMCATTASCLGIAQELVAVSSTGVIGVFLPMDRIETGIKNAASSLSTQGNADAASAIMTTDTFPKHIAIQISIEGHSITIGGIAKGSGMVHPNMATILGFLTTDANIAPDALQAALSEGNDQSFNMISVDGDTSTNDMILVLANGLSQNPRITLNTPAFQAFKEGVQYVLTYLAKQIAKDGEGATKLIEVCVKGAPSEKDAKRAARAVSCSLLVKTAIFGKDANWGRILCALGYSGATFDPSKVNLSIGHIQVMKEGSPIPFDEGLALEVLSQNEVIITADLQSGTATATSWGCDLSYDYVKINGAYRT